MQHNFCVKISVCELLVYLRQTCLIWKQLTMPVNCIVFYFFFWKWYKLKDIISMPDLWQRKGFQEWALNYLFQSRILFGHYRWLDSTMFFKRKKYVHIFFPKCLFLNYNAYTNTLLPGMQAMTCFLVEVLWDNFLLGTIRNYSINFVWWTFLLKSSFVSLTKAKFLNWGVT